MNDYCIKVKRRGFNYYTDYMERYFDKVATHFGYHLVKNPKQAELSCVTFVDQPYTGHSGSKWMIFVSKFFNNLTYGQLQELSQLIAECFKSESVIEEIVMLEMLGAMGNCSSKHGTPYCWYFSRKHNAFDEPPFLTDGETDLKIYSHTAICTKGQPFLLSLQNYGGVSKGLNISISFDTTPKKEVGIYEVALVKAKNKHEVEVIPLKADRTTLDNKSFYNIKLPDFNIPEGINKYSAKLCGKKKADESFIRAFSLRFIPKGDTDELKSMQIEIMPIEYPSKKVIWKNYIRTL